MALGNILADLGIIYEQTKDNRYIKKRFKDFRRF